MKEFPRESSQKNIQNDPFNNLKISEIQSIDGRIKVTATQPGWNSTYKFVVSSDEVIGQTSFGAWEILSKRSSQVIRSKLQSFLISHSPLSH
ncbi:MAG: hypothetical protein JXD21_00225 [Candidatus Omnitrophica bacterium]|nr:hypothetical protein [Candidatus Omnitrophota bacterium]